MVRQRERPLRRHEPARGPEPDAEGEPLLEILSVKPGTGRAKELFPHVGFKAGALNLTWLVKSEAGRWYVVTLGANRTQGNVDLPEAISVATGMFEPLAGEQAESEAASGQARRAPIGRILATSWWHDATHHPERESRCQNSEYSRGDRFVQTR